MVAARYNILYSAEIMLFYTLSARYRLLILLDNRHSSCLPGLPVNPGVPIRVIFRFGLDEAVVTVCNLAIPHYHNAHRADACTLLVGRFEIYCCKIFHSLILFSNTFCRLSEGFIPSFFRILPRWVVILDSVLLSRIPISLNFLFCRMR